MSPADEDQPLPVAEEAALFEALEAALRPGQLDAQLNERLIEMALEDPLAPPSAEELAASQRLRHALESDAAHEDAALLIGLRSAVEPVSGGDARAAVEKALSTEKSRHRKVEAPKGRGRGNLVYAAFGAASAALAVAAMLVLFMGTAHESAVPPAAAADYAKPRSTTPLFSEPFATRDTTARVDLIASARARDLRGNRYASWGVR